jgi:hypothetical protein
MDRDLSDAFFEEVNNFSRRAQALREFLIVNGLRKTSVHINFHAPNAPDILQTLTHEETADYLEEAQHLISRLDRQLDHDAHSIQSIDRAIATGNLLENLVKRAGDLAKISPLREEIHIPYAAMTPEERQDALGDIGLSLTQAFLSAALANPDICVEDVEIKVEPVQEKEVKKALQRGDLSPITKTSLIVSASAMPGPDLRAH